MASCVVFHTPTSHVSYMTKSCLTYQSFKSPISMTHVSHINDSCLTYPRVICHQGVMSHISKQVTSHVSMSHVSHMDESCLTHDRVLSHTSISHVSHIHESYINESYLTYLRTIWHQRYQFVLNHLRNASTASWFTIHTSTSHVPHKNGLIALWSATNGRVSTF